MILIHPTTETAGPPSGVKFGFQIVPDPSGNPQMYILVDTNIYFTSVNILLIKQLFFACCYFATSLLLRYCACKIAI